MRAHYYSEEKHNMKGIVNADCELARTKKAEYEELNNMTKWRGIANHNLRKPQLIVVKSQQVKAEPEKWE